MERIKLTPRRYPILTALEWDKNLLEHPKKGTEDSPLRAFGFRETRGSYRYWELLSAFKEIAQNWPYFRSRFAMEVEYINDKFWESVMACRDSLMKKELLEPLLGQTFAGTFLAKDKVILYNFMLKQLEPLGASGTLICIEKNCLLGVYSCEIKGVIGQGISYEINDRMKLDPSVEIIGLSMRDVVLLHLFKMYADVQTVQAKPHKKVATENGDTFLVESGIPVKLIDCRWITTIVRSEGFKVRGHFRLQSCGPEHKDRKLIYINEFEKHGYTRRATKLIELEK